jgi:hypothetical protein
MSGGQRTLVQRPPRVLTAAEHVVLLLSIEFPGAERLREQARSAANERAIGKRPDRLGSDTVKAIFR